MHVRRRTQQRLLKLTGTALILAAAALTVAGVAPAALGAGSGSQDALPPSLSADPTASIPGSKVIDLSGMDPRFRPRFLRVIAEVAAAYDLKVPYILPSDRWNQVTGAPAADAIMFASDLGIAFDPAVWRENTGSGEEILHSLASFSHSAANGKTFEALVVHELAHVLLAQRFGSSLVDVDNPVRLLVERYREQRGAQTIMQELGRYAWRGSSDRRAEAWQETFAEAFAAYCMDPHSVSGATTYVVAQVLLL